MATKKAAASPKTLAPARPVESLIRVIREQRVMVDRDLAALYGVETRVFNQAVRRNRDRFPEDFMFQLTQEEAESLRSQSVILEQGRGRHSKYLPLAFTEQGIAMLSSVLNSERAIQANIMIVRAFVRMRELIAANQHLAERVDKLEHGQAYASSMLEALLDDIEGMAHEIRELKAPPEASPRRIGFSHQAISTESARSRS